MSETMTAGHSRTLDRLPLPTPQVETTNNITGDYSCVYSSGDAFSYSSINVVETIVLDGVDSSGTFAALSIDGIVAQGTADLSQPNPTAATLTMTSSSIVIYASLCQLLDPLAQCVVLLFVDPDKIDSLPVGVWVGTSSGGSSPWPPIEA
jgi:hypothetical protein